MKCQSFRFLTIFAPVSLCTILLFLPASIGLALNIGCAQTIKSSNVHPSVESDSRASASGRPADNRSRFQQTRSGCSRNTQVDALRPNQLRPVSVAFLPQGLATVV